PIRRRDALRARPQCVNVEPDGSVVISRYRRGRRHCRSWRGWNAASSRKRNHLSLGAGLVAKWHTIEPFHIARLVRRKHAAALNTTHERLYAIFHRRAQQRARVEFAVFLGLAPEIKQAIKRLLNVVQTKAESGRQPKMH